MDNPEVFKPMEKQLLLAVAVLQTVVESREMEDLALVKHMDEMGAAPLVQQITQEQDNGLSLGEKS